MNRMIPALYKKDKEPTKYQLAELKSSTIEDKIFSPDDVRFMQNLR